MLLTIDVGNTQTVLGLFKDETLMFSWRLSTHKNETSDELRLKFLPLLENADVRPSAIQGSIIASVVPSLTASWVTMLTDLFGAPPVICSAKTAGDLFPNDYDDPNEVGADRVADAIAANATYGAPVLVVDFGTATNIEVIDANGDFVGGIIAPGLETSASALFSHATKLPGIELTAPSTAIGRDTTSAMRSGIVFGEADRVDGFVHRIFDELGYSAPVVATGGLAKTMGALCASVTHIDPDLTLKGLRLLYEHVSSMS